MTLKLTTEVIELRTRHPFVIARGGGSFEELYAFNTEVVARAILASKLPVVTAERATLEVSDFAAFRPLAGLPLADIQRSHAAPALGRSLQRAAVMDDAHGRRERQ